MNNIKRPATLVLAIMMNIILSSCTVIKKGNFEPEFTQMKSITELAALECYFHNVAKFQEKDASGVFIWKKDKNFWIEYSGIVKFGIDPSLLNIEVKNELVTIKIPKAEILDSSIDRNSLSKASFIVEKDSAKIKAQDEKDAMKVAQINMEEIAKNDVILLESAQQRVKALLEKSIENIGTAAGVDYEIKWVEPYSSK